MNICALKSPARDLSSREAVVAPHGLGRRRVIGRQVLGALARGDHLEAGGARPVDQLGRSAPAGRRRRASRRCRPRAARRASSGPASASASTLTITMCLRCSQHASAWRMPAAGCRSRRSRSRRRGAAISASASSVTKVVPLRTASANERARVRARPSQPTRASDARAAVRRQVGDGDEMDARRARRLRRGTSSRICRRRSVRP